MDGPGERQLDPRTRASVMLACSPAAVLLLVLSDPSGLCAHFCRWLPGNRDSTALHMQTCC